MIKNDDKITSQQLFAVLTVEIIGIGTLSLPREVASMAGSSGWMLIVLGALLTMGFAYIVTRLSRLFINDTIVEYSKKIMGGFLGTIISLLLVIYFIFFVGIQVRVFGEVLKMFLLYYTPLEVVIITMLLTCIYIVRHGIEPVARLSELILPIMIIVMFIIIIPALKDFDLTKLLPFFHVNIFTFLRGIGYTAFAFVGYEAMLFLVPFLKKPHDSTRYTNYAIIFAAIFNLVLVIITLGVFGTKENTHLVWPVLSLIKTINIPGFFIENLEGVVILVWTFSIFATIDVVLYMLSLGFSRLAKSNEYSFVVMVIIPVVYFIAMTPSDLVQTFVLFRIVTVYTAAILTVFVPLLLLIIAKIRGIGGDKNAKKSEA